MPQRTSKIIFISSLIFFVVFFWFSKIQKDIPLIQPASASIQQAKMQVSDISIAVVVGNATINLSFPQGWSLYEAFSVAQKRGQIHFDGRQYPSLGFFVTAIESLRSSEGRNLIYDINGAEAPVGISIYRPQDGDIISWQLK